MEERILDNWWSSIRMKEKLHIANKIKADADNPVTTPQEATDIWLSQDAVSKMKIYDHCRDDHQFLEHEEKEGQSFSY